MVLQLRFLIHFRFRDQGQGYYCSFMISKIVFTDMMQSRGAKLDAAIALVLSFAPGTKAIVVAAWKPLLLEAKEALCDARITSDILEGPTNRRAVVLRRFRDGETVETPRGGNYHHVHYFLCRRSATLTNILMQRVNNGESKDAHIQRNCENFITTFTTK